MPKDARARYSKVLGSAVNPVLREGNSDRRAPRRREAYARKHPHSMGKWSKASQSHADYMRGGDFSSEQSITMEKAGDVRIEFVGKDGKVEVKQLALQEGEVLDSMFMSCRSCARSSKTRCRTARKPASCGPCTSRRP